MHLRILHVAGAVSLVLAGLITPALADAIDGDWCRSDGKRMSNLWPGNCDARWPTNEWGLHAALFLLCHPVR